ncbi:MAG: Fpg/Nei family DNA glycosylase [Chloroflexota bacterium]
MPELPEVENLAEGLRARVVGKEIVEVRCRQPKMINLPAEEFAARARGRVIDVRRRGKSCVLCLADGGSIWLHLGLGGLVTAGDPPAADPQMTLVFADGSELTISKTFMGHAHYHGPEAYAARWAEYGPEPTDPDFTLDRLRAVLAAKPKQALKALLMDQARLAGIGNIYSDEILYAARLSPNRPAGSVTEAEAARLHEAMGQVLAEAKATRGEHDFVHLDGGRGAYRMRVHKAQTCESCGGPITQATLAGRTAYYCPKCQV